MHERKVDDDVKSLTLNAMPGFTMTWKYSATTGRVKPGAIFKNHQNVFKIEKRKQFHRKNTNIDTCNAMQTVDNFFFLKEILSSIKICIVPIRFATAFEKYSQSQVLTAINRVQVNYRDSLPLLLRKCNSETEDHIDQILDYFNTSLTMKKNQDMEYMDKGYDSMIDFKNMTDADYELVAKTYLKLVTCPSEPWMYFYEELFEKKSVNQIVLTLNRMLKGSRTEENRILKDIANKLFNKVASLLHLKYQHTDLEAEDINLQG